MEILDVKPSESKSTVTTCKNCSAVLHGEYCSACGQKTITERITLPKIFHDLFAIFTNLEKGFWYTLKMLFVNPGEVIRNYINGKTVQYYPPLRYLLLWVAISVALSLFTGLYDQQQEAMQELTTMSQKPEVAEMQRKMQQQIQNEMRKYLNFLPLAMLPFMGLASLLAFRRRGENYAEHLVLNAYAYGQTTAVGIVIQLLILAFPKLIPFLAVKVILLSVLYYTYLYRSFFQVRTAQATIKAVFSTVLGYTMAITFFGIIGMIVGIFMIVKMKGG
ncbi:MAG: DUF3667 domain-containing protein [Saprospiraceae bacterium]